MPGVHRACAGTRGRGETVVTSDRFYAYHWTTKERATQILVQGLKRRSYVCRRAEDWSGEVCLAVEFDKPLPFAEEGMFSWQLVTSEAVLPFRLRDVTADVRPNPH